MNVPSLYTNISLNWVPEDLAWKQTQDWQRYQVNFAPCIPVADHLYSESDKVARPRLENMLQQSGIRFPLCVLLAEGESIIWYYIILEYYMLIWVWLSLWRLICHCHRMERPPSKWLLMDNWTQLASRLATGRPIYVSIALERRRVQYR